MYIRSLFIVAVCTVLLGDAHAATCKQVIEETFEKTYEKAYDRGATPYALVLMSAGSLWYRPANRYGLFGEFGGLIKKSRSGSTYYVKWNANVQFSDRDNFSDAKRDTDVQEIVISSKPRVRITLKDWGNAVKTFTPTNCMKWGEDFVMQGILRDGGKLTGYTFVVENYG